MVKPSSVSPDAGSEVRFQAYLSTLSEVIGHADRIEPLHRYCTGLLLPGERKSIEPVAARLDPRHVQATHQSLHHFIAKALWSDAAVLAAVREQVLPALTRHGPITAWILDDTGFPKKGKHSVGVARQYCGQLGKQDNCQVAVCCPWPMTRAACRWPLIFTCRRRGPTIRSAAKAGVPKSLAFRTKPQIALEQIRRALADGLPPGVVLGDAAYGVDTDFRTALTASSVSYVLGVPSTLGVWPPGCGPLPPKPGSGKGRRTKLQRRDDAHQPVSAKDLALTLPASAWQTVSWRAGSQGELSGRFAAVRVRSSHRDYWRSEPHAEEWLLMSGRRATRSRPGIGSRPCRPRPPWSIWSTWPSCAGTSSGITRISSRNSGSIIMKGAAGVVFIITPPCAWRLMASSSASEVFFPLKSASNAKRLRHPQAGGPEDIPVRPERHDPSSITSVRRRLTAALARRLPRCPCCLPRCPCCQQQHFRVAAPALTMADLGSIRKMH